MCKFFSLVSDGAGNPMYFDSVIRKKIISGELKKYELDSHTSIADYFGHKGEKEDVLNKYEYNPITKVFTIDQLNTKDDSKDIEKFCNKLDFKTIVPELNIHPIVHPLKDFRVKEVTREDLELLKKWASVWDSVRDSVRDSVWDSVGDSVGALVWDSVGALVGDSVGDSVRASVRASVWDSVGDSVWASVRASVWDSVGASVWDSVWASVRDSVWDSVGAYIGTYFDIKYKVDISPSNKLWNKGIVPSFDGTLWRLHGGGGKEIWKGKIEDIK